MLMQPNRNSKQENIMAIMATHEESDALETKNNGGESFKDNVKSKEIDEQESNDDREDKSGKEKISNEEENEVIKKIKNEVDEVEWAVGEMVEIEMELKQLERKEHLLRTFEEELQQRKAEIEKVATEGLQEFKAVKSKFDWEILHFKKQLKRFRERLKKKEVHFERMELHNGEYDGKVKADLPHGLGRWRNFDGKRKVKAEWKNGLKDGLVIETVCQHHYLYQARNGKPNGKYIHKHRDRTLFEREYRDGRPHGQSQYYDERGSMICIEVYENGQLREIKSRGKARRMEQVAVQCV